MSSENPLFVSALLQSSAYPHSVSAPVKLVETHCSWVFLTGDFVYKVKKPVHFSFMDFSTLEKRKHFCEEELKLNARLCPEIYLGIQSIVQTPQGYTLIAGIQSNAVEFAVKMKQLPEEKRMTNLLGQNQVTMDHIQSLAKILYAFHQKAQPVKDSAFCSPEKILSEAQDWVCVYPVIERELVMVNIADFVLRRMQVFLESRHELFLERQRTGFVRDCHGDFHSANVFLLPSNPCIFDCIEFNIDFRYIDVVREIAFMAMDLDAFEREDLSREFVESYQKLANDSALQTLLPLYKCYYANVRAKVSALEFQQTHSKDAIARVKKYLLLCEKYAEQLR